MVARALKDRARKPLVFTKCERVWNERREIGTSLKAGSIRREVEASLRRLQLDVIDLYQIHWPEPEEDIEEGWTAMAQLQHEGKVRWIGVSNFNVDQLRRAHAIAPVTSLQPLFDYFAGNRRGGAAVHAGARHRRHRIFADEIGPAVGRHDARARRRHARRRFSPAYAEFLGAAANTQSGIG